jgi:metallo-beta-lactamase class B
MRNPILVIAGSLIAATTGLPAAQAPPAPPAAKPDSPEVLQLLQTARNDAGAEWIEAFDFICGVNGRGNSPTDPEISPAKIFDNLYVIGRTSTVVWAVTTTAGIVLIDSGYADQLESVLLPGMKTLGLDPARVRYVFVGHGHADHFGGAAYFQRRGARVVMAGPDWDLVENPAPAGRGPAPAGGAAPPVVRGPAPAPVQPPKRDVVAVEGQAITVGDAAFTPVMVPGHTPGSMGVVFPVQDGSTTRMAALFGGSILTPGRISDDGLRQYISSIGHFADVTRRMNVEVEIQNHPMYDGFLAKLDRLSKRTPGEPNPFVVGRESYQRFLRVMSGCAQAQLARRAG